MKTALLLPLLLALNPSSDVQPIAHAEASYPVAVEAAWTAHLSSRDADRLQLNVSQRKGSTLGTTVAIDDLEGLTRADIQGAGGSVTFRLRREAGTISFTGHFSGGRGEGTLRYEGDQAYWSKIAAMGVENDWSDRRHNLLALPLLDVRIDYIAALRREGAMGSLSDYVGMRAVNVSPQVVREVRPLIAGAMKPHDLMALAALGVTPDYVRGMRSVFAGLTATQLSSMKSLGVTSDYIASMRAAGARIDTAGEAQSFKALGISPAAVRQAVDRGWPNPSASDVMRMNIRY